MRFRRDPRIADEIRFHRDRLVEDYMAAGMGRREAERRAFLEFGNAAHIEEACRDARGRWLDDLSRDVRHALRSLRRSPAFSAVAVLSFALGIGANAAIFSLVNAVMLRPLPVPEPEGLVRIARLLDGRPGAVPYPLFEHVRAHLESISGAFVQGTSEVSIVVDGEEELVTADLVSGEYARVLGLDAAAGRLLAPADDDLSSAPAAVITDRFWERRFNRSPAALGRPFALRDRTFTIVGVMPASFQSARPGFAPDLILPLALMMSDVQRRSTDYNWLGMLARLKPGASVEQADAELQVLYGPFRQAQADRAAEKERSMLLRQRAAVLPAPDGLNPIRQTIAQPLAILMGIVALILLLACVNLSGLLLARAAAREREISIRLAIGASRGRLMRQFLTESLVLAAFGAAAGLAMAGWVSEKLFGVFLAGRQVTLQVAPDWRVLAFTCAVAVAACCVAGLAPALQAVRVAINPSLKQVKAQGRVRLGPAFVVVQLAISMVVAVAASLFVGTFVKLHAVDRGFDSGGVLVVNVRAIRPYAPERAAVVQEALLERLRTFPDVQSASAAAALPVGGALWDRGIRVEGYHVAPDQSDTAGFNVIAPGYFATLRTPLLSGREFGAHDTAAAPRVTIVNESFAKRFFGSASPLGRRVTSVNVTYEIVGVVRDAKYQSLREPVISTMYIPWSQRDEEQPARYHYLLRTAAGDPLRLVRGLDRAVREVDPALRVRSARAYDAVVDESIATERIMATLGGFFGALALLVAAIGMFGVVAFQVARRTNELGVRMALGASRSTLLRLVLRDVVVMIALGVSMGAAGALALTGAAARILYGLTPTEPAAFAAAAAALSFAAVAAGWLPARRAVRVDPLVALRHE